MTRKLEDLSEFQIEWLWMRAGDCNGKESLLLGVDGNTRVVPSSGDGLDTIQIADPPPVELSTGGDDVSDSYFVTRSFARRQIQKPGHRYPRSVFVEFGAKA